MKLVEVRNSVLPISKNTAYKWHSMGKHPHLLVKVAGKLFFDWDEWYRLAEEAKEKAVRRAPEEVA